MDFCSSSILFHFNSKPQEAFCSLCWQPKDIWWSIHFLVHTFSFSMSPPLSQPPLNCWKKVSMKLHSWCTKDFGHILASAQQVSIIWPKVWVMFLTIRIDVCYVLAMYLVWYVGPIIHTIWVPPIIRNQNTTITYNTFCDSIVNQVRTQQVHEHMQTCEKGLLNRTGCQMCFGRRAQNTTHPVLLMSLEEDSYKLL